MYIDIDLFKKIKMMQFSIVTIFPKMFNNIFKYGVINRAITNNIININIFNLRNFSTGKRRKVDDKIYGGGSGMLFMFLPLLNAVTKIKKMYKKNSVVVYLSPQGKLLNYQNIQHFLNAEHLIFICGRYRGIDERFIRTQVDEEWSIGNYILTGGELPAMVFIDSITRLLPGVLNNKNSLLNETFSKNLLDCPHYTRPKKINNIVVPKILLSGNHKKIKKWRLQQSLKNTVIKKPKLIEK